MNSKVCHVYKFWSKSVPRNRFSQGFIAKRGGNILNSLISIVQFWRLSYFQNNIILRASETEAVVSLEL